ncbi:MAG: methionyl-tRNA formyltransferase [Rhizobacter sp.]
MRVAFAGTPEFAKVALQALVEAGFVVPLVLTRPDRPAGRGMKLQPSAVKAYALSQDLPVIQPRSLRRDGKTPEDAVAAQQALEQAQIDVMVVAAYGLILPQWVLSLPRLGCLNIHASLLPRWRGAAPIHRAIEAGDAQTGITLMQMDAGLDTGAILRMATVAIEPSDTTASLHDRLAALGADLTVAALPELGTASLLPLPQPSQGVTYAHKIEKAEAGLDWAQPAHAIERRIRAFDPFPGVAMFCAGEVVKVWRAEVVSGTGPAGEVLHSGQGELIVACGQNALRLLELQRPGGKRLPAAQCLQGRWPAQHSRLEAPAPS